MSLNTGPKCPFDKKYRCGRWLHRTPLNCPDKYCAQETIKWKEYFESKEYKDKVKEEVERLKRMGRM